MEGLSFMASHQFDRRPASPISETTPEKPAQPGAQPPDASLLEKVLVQTLNDQSVQSLEAGDREILRAVARRHSGAAFAFEPIAVELVEALLRSQLAPGAEPSESWGVMCRQIAQTMFDDPVSHNHLNALWNLLCQTER
jgi:hypothetical protein